MVGWFIKINMLMVVLNRSTWLIRYWFMMIMGQLFPIVNVIYLVTINDIMVGND